MYAEIRKWVRIGISWLLVLAVGSILGQISINAATEAGYIPDMPIQAIRARMSSVFGWPYWPQVIWFITGVFAWSWLDWGLRKIFAPSMLRQLVDEQLYENALEFVEIGVVRCVPAGEPIATVFPYAKIRNISSYGLYMSISGPFFSIDNKVNQDFLLDSRPVFLGPNSEYPINIPMVAGVNISQNMTGRFRVELPFGVEEDNLEKRLLIDVDFALSVRYDEEGNMRWSCNSVMKQDEFVRS